VGTAASRRLLRPGHFCPPLLGQQEGSHCRYRPFLDKLLNLLGKTPPKPNSSSASPYGGATLRAEAGLLSRKTGREHNLGSASGSRSAETHFLSYQAAQKSLYAPVI